MKVILAIILVAVILFPGCVTSVKEIRDNPDKYIGETVTVEGTASSSIKIGKLSGFTLVQDDGSKIAVSSENLPKDDSRVTVTGVVMKDTIFGIYILAK
jgi:hypothetical protein